MCGIQIRCQIFWGCQAWHRPGNARASLRTSGFLEVQPAFALTCPPEGSEIRDDYGFALRFLLQEDRLLPLYEQIVPIRAVQDLIEWQ